MERLTIVELTALVKLAEKEQKQALLEGVTIPPGNHTFKFSLQLDGSLSRGSATQVTPPFSIEKFLKPLFLKYASSLGVVESGQWLQALMSRDGALPAVIQLGADTVLRSIDPTLIAIWDNAEATAKSQFQRIAPKTDRAGNTVVVGEIQQIDGWPTRRC